MTDETEITLTGGRITQGVVRIGDKVHRPQCANAPFVHSVLTHLQQCGVPYAPRYFGIDERGREVLSFLPGAVPPDLGHFSDEQIAQGSVIIRRLHDALSSFPDCPQGMTVCHNDLSPCNFVFEQDLPCAVIDWDAASFGHPLDDLAYAAWMWLDIGNDEQSADDVRRRILLMLRAYGAREDEYPQLLHRMLRQMQRVGGSTFPTPEHTAAVRAWTDRCAGWVRTHLDIPSHK